MSVALQREIGVSPVFSAWYPLAYVLFGIAIVVRALAYPFVTTDYTGFLTHWFSALQSHGLAAFATPFANYAPLYLYFLRLLAYIPLPSLYSIKTLSVLFDAVLSFLTYCILREVARHQPRAYATFGAALMFIVPTLLINSSVWAQSDALYAAGVLASLYFLLRRQPLYATIAFAFALSVKVQAIFFLPVLIGYMLRERGTIAYMLSIPVLFFCTLIPALLAGGSFSYWGLIYFRQAAEYPWLSLSAPSVFAFLNHYSATPTGQLLSYIGIAIAGMLSLCVVVYIARRKQIAIDHFVLLSLWCVLAIPLFLPHMHERYFYLADMLSVLYALLVPKRWFVPVLVVSCSLLAYMPFLAQQSALFAPFSIDLRIPAGVLFVTFLYLSARTFGKPVGATTKSRQRPVSASAHA